MNEMGDAMTEMDGFAIREHISMLHTLAAPFAGRGKLVIASFGEDPIQTNAKTGKPGRPIVPKITHFLIGDVDHTVDWIIRISGERHRNVYASLAVMRPDLLSSKKGEEAGIVAVLGVVADFDDAAAANWAERVPLPPDLVVETSRGRFQCFYLFDKPEPVERAKPIGRRLRDFCRSDHGSLDLSHVWRIPGCLNWPNAKKIAQGRSSEPQLVRKGGDAVTHTTLDALDAALPPPPTGTTILPPFTLGGTGTELPDEPAGTSRSGRAANVTSEHNLELILKALPQKLQEAITKPEAIGGDRSTTLFRVIKDLGRRGIPPDVIEQLIRMHPEGVGAKFVARKDLAQEIQRVLSKQSRRQAMQNQVQAARAGKAVLRLIPGLLPESLDETENHVLASAVEIYQRGDFVVRPGVIERRTAAGEIFQKPGLVVVTPHNMVELFTSVIDFQVWDNRSDEWRSIDCQLSFATAYLQRTRHWRLRPLTAIITAPTLRPDDSILETPGYDEQTGILYDPLGVSFPPVPQNPTEEDALVALEELKKPLREVAFEPDPKGQDEDDLPETSASRSVMLSVILTAVIRSSLRTAPAHGFSAPVAGSGKSKMVNFAAIIATGQEAASFVPAEDDVELSKQVGAALIEGEGIIALDNCDHLLKSAMLAQALTETLVKVRILGRSEMCTVLNTALFTVTGNNLKLAGDLPRRALRSIIDPKVERPELREFVSEDPIVVARRDRPRLVIAALTILRAYHLARGKPLSRPLGSFEDWSQRVRDALIWLGESDPCITMSAIREEDPELSALKTVMAQWEAWLGYGEFIGQQIIARATWSEDKPLLPGFKQLTSAPEFREALLAVAGKNGAINSQKLGNFFARYKDRIVDNRRFVNAGVLYGHTKWRLESIS